MSNANTNATGPQDTNPLTSPSIMSSTQLSSSTSSISTHTVTEGVGSGDGGAQNTTPADPMTNNINGQAEHGHDRARNSPQGGATQRRRMRVALTISTSTEVATTDGQELGLGDLATGNDMQAPSALTRRFDDPTLFGVPQTNHHWTTPLCRQRADNFVNFGIPLVADSSHFDEPASESSRLMERSTSSGMAALSSHPPAEGIDDGVPREGIVLRDFSHDLDEWPTPAGAESGNPNGQVEHGNRSNSPEPAGHRSTTPPTRNDDVVNRNRRAPRDVVPSLRRV
ncbi:hypothetical protein AG0111_0g12095 [Alternaria gaisen]|uniref:Uncharacterized protein n=1 Tax=Alternaria gaisen TaxID=167740 RepID=A0ACB6F579_9PLEO|nr:hypothetical protein AG0111_0g12095 [Alternaria gaisen]